MLKKASFEIYDSISELLGFHTCLKHLNNYELLSQCDNWKENALSFHTDNQTNQNRKNVHIWKIAHNRSKIKKSAFIFISIF